jgi:hypothetical protein
MSFIRVNYVEMFLFFIVRYDSIIVKGPADCKISPVWFFKGFFPLVLF